MKRRTRIRIRNWFRDLALLPVLCGIAVMALFAGNTEEE